MTAHQDDPNGKKPPALSTSQSATLEELPRFIYLSGPQIGGTAHVFFALDTLSNKKVAVKIAGREPRQLNALLNEATLLRRHNLVGLPSYVTSGVTHSGCVYLATAFIEGQTLASLITANGPLSIQSVINLGIRLTTLLQALHTRGVVHRDLSPTNVIIPHDDYYQAAIIDLANAVETQGATTISDNNFYEGTPGFVAPEIAMGQKTSPQTDLFGLGALLYYSLTGQAPQQTADHHATHAAVVGIIGTIRAHRHDAPDELIDLIERLLGQSAENRPAPHETIEILSNISANFDAPASRVFTQTERPLARSGLHGREHLVSRITEQANWCIDQKNTNRSVAVVLNGAAGMGKSALVGEWVQINQHRFHSLWFGCATRGSHPLGLLEQLIVAAYQTEPILPLLENSTTLQEAAFIDELLREVIADQSLPDPSALLRLARRDPSLLAAQIEWAWLKLLDCMTKKGPLCIVVDDLHWSDVASVRLLQKAFTQTTIPFFLLLATRPEVNSVQKSLIETLAPIELSVDELSKESATAIVKSLWPMATDSDIEQIVLQGAGCPLFVEHLARERANHLVAEIPFEGGITTLLDQRVKERNTHERICLAAASVLGSAFDHEAIYQVVGGTIRSIDIAQSLQSLELAGLLRRIRTGAYVFKHDLLRDSAQSLEHELPENAQQRALQWMTAHGETDAMLATLAERAGQNDEAAEHHEKASSRGLAAADFEAALFHAQRGISLTQNPTMQGRLYACLAHAQAWTGQWDLVKQSAQNAFEKSDPGTLPWLRGVTASTFAAYELGETAHVPRWLTILANSTPEPDAASLLAWALAINIWPLASGHCDRSLFGQFCSKMDWLNATFTDTRIAACAERISAFVAWFLNNDLWGALLATERSMKLFEQAADTGSVLQIRLLYGYLFNELGQYKRAIDMHSQTLELAEAAGASSTATYARLTLAESLMFRGQTTDSMAHLETLWANKGFVRRRFLYAWSQRIAAQILLDDGDTEMSIDYCQRALTVLPPFCTERASCMTILARALIRTGRLTEALTISKQSVTLIESANPVILDNLGARFTHATALRRAGHVDEAIQQFQLATSALQEKANRITEEFRNIFLTSSPTAQSKSN